jgi:hypothetical protein
VKTKTFQYLPVGTHRIRAGFRHNDSIIMHVRVKKGVEKKLNESLEIIKATEKSKPFFAACEKEQAAMGWPVGFSWVPRKGVFLTVKLTKAGQKIVNGFCAANFTTAADCSKARCKNGCWTFPDKTRGGENNPAEIIGTSFCVGAVTQNPSFKTIKTIA